jgi:phasin family protein
MDQVYTDVIKNVAEVNKQAVESMLRLGRIAVRTQGLFASQQVAAVEDCLAASAKYMSAVSQTQNPQELMKKQTEINVELGEKFVAASQEALDVQAQVRDELASWFEDGMKVVQEAAEKVEMPAVKAVKTAKTTKKAA